MGARDKERYYWIKLERGFFNRHDLQILESLPNGKEYSLFYLKLMLESVDHEGYLRFSDMIPYSTGMLATITNTDEDRVKAAMKALQELGMVQVLSDQTIYIQAVSERLGSETYAAARKRDQRSEIPAGDNVPQLSQNCPQEIELELELDKEIDIELDNISSSKEDDRPGNPDMQAVMDAWNELDLQKLRLIAPGSVRERQVKKRIKDYGLDTFLEGIKRIKKSSFLQGENKKGWTITFDWFILPNNFPKVLEGNYDGGAKKPGSHAAAFDPGAIDDIKI